MIDSTAERRARKLERTFRHTFKRDPDDPDVQTCAECGLNIRDLIHERRHQPTDEEEGDGY